MFTRLLLYRVFQKLLPVSTLHNFLTVYTRQYLNLNALKHHNSGSHSSADKYSSLLGHDAVQIDKE
jgi:hypothetical protein